MVTFQVTAPADQEDDPGHFVETPQVRSLIHHGHDRFPSLLTMKVVTAVRITDQTDFLYQSL